MKYLRSEETLFAAALLAGLLVVSLLSGCAPKGDLPRFHEVDPGKLYRSAQPSEEGYRQLKSLGINTVLKLNTEQDEEETRWAEKFHILLVKIPMPGLTAPSKEQMKDAQASMNNKLNWPVLVHCTQGQDRTGLAVAVYRIITQTWTYEDARREWKDAGHSIFLQGMDWFLEGYK